LKSENLEIKIEIFGNLAADFTDYTDFWVKNGGWGVELYGLGKIGKKKAEKSCKK